MDGDLAISHPRGVSAARAGGATPAVDKNLTRLTVGERLWLWRINERSAVRSATGKGNNGGRLTQIEAAERLGVDPTDYTAAEHGAETKCGEHAVLVALQGVEEPELTTALQLRLARRRVPEGLGAVVLDAGMVSRPTFLKLEAAGDKRLVAYWRARGFRF